MKKVKLLFQGDSITDAGRDRESNDLGPGYPAFAAKYLQETYPDIAFTFINKGISGNQTKDLVDRLEEDFIAIQPDVVSIMIGVNDTWHRAESRDWLDNDLFEERYRTVLAALKERTNARIVILEPYLIPVEDKLYFRDDMYSKIEIVRKLAREYADLFVPVDGLLQAAFVGDDFFSFGGDGVHPSPKGAEFIGRIYNQWVGPKIAEW